MNGQVPRIIGLGFLLLIAATAGPVASQDSRTPLAEHDVQKQVWVDYVPSYFRSAKVELYGDLSVRHELRSRGWWRLVVRPSVRYTTDQRIDILGGLGSFYTANATVADRWELRPWQGLGVTWPRSRVSLEHLLRLEERFEFNTSTWQSLSALRVRYRLRVSHRWAALQSGRWWRVFASGEGFATVAGEQGQFREQIRVTLGLERSVRRTLRFRFESTWEQGGRFLSLGDPINAIYLRLGVDSAWGGGKERAGEL